MTVCIAALANEGRELVLVSDSKVTFGQFSADRAVQKNIPFIHSHIVEVAGNDVAKAGAVINRSKARVTNGRHSSDEIAEVIYEECKRERDRVADAKVLNKHGYDHTFRIEVKTSAPQRFSTTSTQNWSK